MLCESALQFLPPCLTLILVCMGEPVHVDARTDYGDLRGLDAFFKQQIALFIRKNDDPICKFKTDMIPRHHHGADDRASRGPCNDQPEVVRTVKRCMDNVDIVLLYQLPQEQYIPDPFHGDAVTRDAHGLHRIGDIPCRTAADHRYTVTQ